MVDKLITKEVCEKVLKNYFNHSNFTLKNFKLKPISEDAEGFLGEHNKLVIHFQVQGSEECKTFFVKTKAFKNEFQKSVADGMDVYKKEIFVYDFLLKEFEKYGLDVSFATKSYYCIDDNCLIMTDITDEGFAITDRHSELSFDETKSALRSLALYHAAGYAYEKIKSKELGRTFLLGEDFKDVFAEQFFIHHINFNKEFVAYKFWEGSFKTLPTLIELLPETEEFKRRFKNLIINYDFGKVFAENHNIAKTCGHGDLWSNNMLFRKEENQELSCKLVDFQIIRYFYPSLDIILAIYCNTGSDFRRKHLQTLLQYYHQQLTLISRNYGLNIEEIYPWNDFKKSVDLVVRDAMFQIILTNCIIYLPKKDISTYIKEDEKKLGEVMFDNEKLAAEAFKTDLKYRTILTELLYDFYEMLTKCD